MICEILWVGGWGVGEGREVGQSVDRSVGRSGLGWRVCSYPHVCVSVGGPAPPPYLWGLLGIGDEDLEDVEGLELDGRALVAEEEHDRLEVVLGGDELHPVSSGAGQG